RRSVRSYANEPLTLQQVSQLLWAAQGITEPTKGLRTAPSAMAMYPLRVYLIANNVRDLPAGVYRYIPQGHKIELVQAGDQHTNIGGQPQMQSAPVLIVYAADETQAIARAGEKRARQWTDIEVGHSAQNVLLEEIAQGLVGVGMGGFDEAKMRSVLQLPASQTLIYVVSAGKPK
ncbi:MAG TPA: SagB/ThcOx family dehydrogenase, partial [Armatimonadota bacterium]|nr:SagB/ThcOx family dehydrogenase [Armatimonadota bacterium]